MKRFTHFVFIVFSSFFLTAEEPPLQFEGQFGKWSSKKIDLFSLFLPENPKDSDLFYVRGQDFGEEIALATCIYLHSPSKKSYLEAKKRLAKAQFKQVAHWYRRGEEDEGFFVKRAFFYNEAVHEFLEEQELIHQDYKIYYEPFFRFSYFLEDVTFDSIKNILKQGLPYEGHIGQIIEQLVEPGSIAVDIGAHIGVHTLTMSRNAGGEGAVFAFEPNKKSYAELIQNLLLNHQSNVIPICKALGERRQDTFLGEHKIEEDFAGKKGEWVETVPLDQYHLENVSLIKMDIENYEYHALLGMKETLLKNKPTLIFECWIGKDYENSSLAEKTNFDRVIALLEEYGYETYVIFSNDFIAFPLESSEMQAYFKTQFRKLDFDHFDLGL
jgi:FkbM family methyltransferase